MNPSSEIKVKSLTGNANHATVKTSHKKLLIIKLDTADTRIHIQKTEKQLNKTSKLAIAKALTELSES
jgi:hypothetical protein